MDQRGYTISGRALKEIAFTLGDVFVVLGIKPKRHEGLMDALIETVGSVESKDGENGQSQEIVAELNLIAEVLMRREKEAE